MAEKTEKPTEKKRRDSAKKGQTFKSKDLTTTAVLFSGLYFLTDSINFDRFTSFYTLLLVHSTEITVNDFLTEMGSIFFQLTLPFIALCVVAGSATTLLQTKFTVSTEALKLNFKALNPVEGIKKIFSMRTVKELVKSLCYLVVFSCTCYSLMNSELKKVLTVHNGDLAELIQIWSALMIKAVMVFMAWALMVLVADFIAEYYLCFKDLKMDKHEVKQERKEVDGNPEIKSARRNIHMEILSGQDKVAIKNSRVVLANPTHIAIGIYFDFDMAPLPFIALRCSNRKAIAAIAYAKKIGVPVIRNVSLARKLYNSYKQHQFIPANDDAALEVINVLIWLYQVEAAHIENPEIKDDETPANQTDSTS